MVAALLLNATALIIVSAALGLFGATQHATNSTQAWAIALQQMETAAAAPCTSAPAAGATVLGPRRVTWREQWLAGDSSAIVRTVDIAQPTSAWLQFARMALGTLALRDARWCRQ